MCMFIVAMYLPRKFKFLIKDPERFYRLLRDPDWLSSLSDYLSEELVSYLRIVRSARVPAVSNSTLQTLFNTVVVSLYKFYIQTLLPLKFYVHHAL